MKEATGELNMTVVTIIAIGAVIAFFWFMWPQIRNTIQGTWKDIDSGTDCIKNPDSCNTKAE
ncbi:MAG: hypothetical protein MRZ42_05135 [Tenericutes bacterium]|nr:hypothetical protein [Mycoplasmatota bacterium]